MGVTVYWSRQPVMHTVFERFKTLLPDMLEHSTMQSTVSEVILVPTDDELQPERFWTRESSSGFAFAKTSRTPYTTDVMRACILMVELGMVTLESLSNDDEEEFSWLEQIEAVNRYFPLSTYEDQSLYFVKKEMSAVFENVSLADEIKFIQEMIKAVKERKGLSH